MHQPTDSSHFVLTLLQTIKRNQALLEEKKKEQTNDSLLGWLKVIGAVACFAAAAFIPGGIRYAPYVL